MIALPNQVNDINFLSSEESIRLGKGSHCVIHSGIGQDSRPSSCARHRKRAHLEHSLFWTTSALCLLNCYLWVGRSSAVVYIGVPFLRYPDGHL